MLSKYNKIIYPPTPNYTLFLLLLFRLLFTIQNVSQKDNIMPYFNFYCNVYIKYILFFVGYSLIVGCSSSDNNESFIYKIKFHSAKVANTDIKSRRATPLKVHFFFLTSNIKFLEADFFGLQNNTTLLLGNELLKSEQFFLLPEENKTISNIAPKGTRYIGIIAEYLQLNDKVWRLALPIAEDSSWNLRTLWSGNKYYKLNIDVNQTGLLINP